jgi:multiple sugar transport system permease protein
MRPGRVLAYVGLVAIGVGGLLPFLYLALLSTKRRIEIVAEVPPRLAFDWTTVQRNYTEVLYGQGMLGFVWNSLVVVAAATLLALLIGVPAAYAFSRFRFRGDERLASFILSMRFMPPIAVAIPLFLMVR